MKAMADGGYTLIPSCSICLEEYKEPKVLTCGHSFCCQCLHKVVGSDSSNYILCPACRTEVCLPQSGRVEDFITNFELMNLTSDPILDQTRIQAGITSSKEALDPRVQTEEHSLKRKRGYAESQNYHCLQHKTRMEFYCKSCGIQVCNRCLLEDHKPDKHCIVSAPDMAAHLSGHLQKSMAKLQHLQQERTALYEKISAARQNCRNDAQRLKKIIQEILQREKKQLQRAADEMLSAIDEKVEAREHTYDKLERYLYRSTPSNQIYGKCSTLNQLFQQLDLSLAGELKKVDEHMEYVKSCTDSLKCKCESTPTNVGLSINESKHTKLGIKLSESISKNPMILQADD